MIGYLRGAVRGDVIDVGGVGYAVHTPAPLPDGETVELHVHTQVRETAITLYGFRTRLEREIFGALTKATGVGPAMALNLLALGIPVLAAAFAAEDARALAAAKGVGAARAKKLLQDVTLPAAAFEQADTAPAVAGDPLAAGLTGMGYDPDAATAALVQARANHPDADEAVLLRAAMRTLRVPA